MPSREEDEAAAELFERLRAGLLCDWPDMIDELAAMRFRIGVLERDIDMINDRLRDAE